MDRPSVSRRDYITRTGASPLADHKTARLGRLASRPSCRDAGSLRNLFAAKIVSTTKSARTASCATKNGFLRGSHRFQGWHLFERLHDQDKRIEIQRNRGADDVRPAPGSSEVKSVARDDCNRQHCQRDDADLIRGRKVIEGESRIQSHWSAPWS